MKLASICFLFFLSTFYGSVFADELSEIELTDGSIICGEIVSLNDGVYTLKSSSLGTIKIDESEIRLIRLKSNNATSEELASPANTSLNSEVQDLQKLMTSDEEIMNIILSLQNNPDIQDILKDPVIIKALNSGDIATLISNPKFIKLLNNPEIKEIQRKVDK